MYLKVGDTLVLSSYKGVKNGEIKDICLFPIPENSKYIILFMYPLDFTFVCPTELIELGNNLDKFNGEDCDVYGMSVDSAYSHLAWLNQPQKEGGLGGIKLPLLSDPKGKLAKSVGGYNEEEGVCYRTTIIASKCDSVYKIRHISVNDLAIGRNIEEIYRLLQAIKFSDNNDGEACPISWKPGKNSITADPEKSKIYFEENY